MGIRSHRILVGVFPVISHLSSKGPSHLGPRVTEFTGKFSLPFEAEWGGMVLPEGDYALYYGTLGEGVNYVEILGIDQGSSRGIFLVRMESPASVVQNALVCTLEGRKHIIRTLELPAVGKSVSFAGPDARGLMESEEHGTETRFAGVPI